MSVFEPDLAVTGFEWMGAGVGSIKGVLRCLCEEAGWEIGLTVYAASSNACLLFEWLEEALARGIRVKMVVNRLSLQPPDVVSYLVSLAGAHNHLGLYSFDLDDGRDLHAKMLVADRRAALIGSSNLSRRGFVENYEMAALVRGEVAAKAAKALDCLATSRYARRVRQGWDQAAARPRSAQYRKAESGGD